MKTDKFNMVFSIILLFLALTMLNNKQESFFIDYNEAKKQSVEEKKPLLIYFNKSLNDQKISYLSKIKKEYVVCILDYESNKEIFDKFNIKTIPSIVLEDEENKIICKEEGYLEKNKLIELLNKFRKSKSI